MFSEGSLGVSRGNSTPYGTTGKPAMVYIPSGTYTISSPLQLYVGTILTGNPIKPPVIKGTSKFNGTCLINGQDPVYKSLVSFYIAVRNLVLDSTMIPGNQAITLLSWTVSQATQATNLVFNMPNGAADHTGLAQLNTVTSNIMIVSLLPTTLSSICLYVFRMT
jgi:glucan 1,3-beta-glucosidase